MGEEIEMLGPNVVGNSVSRSCRCNELEERCKKGEVTCGELEFELKKKKEHCEELGAKIMALEGEKFEFEDKLKVLSEGLERLKEVGGGKVGEIKTVVDLTEDNEALQLMIKNQVLLCEKIRAESEVEVWKDKYHKLELWALKLGMGRGSGEENGKEQQNKPISNEGNLRLDTSFGFQQNPEKVVAMGNKRIGDVQSAGNTPSDGIVHRSHILDMLPGKKIIKQLKFQTEEFHSKKMDPSRLTGAKSVPVNVIDIIDSDESDEPNITQNPVPDRQGSECISVSTSFAADGKDSNNSCAQNNQESLDLEEHLLFVATPKRKRTCNVVTSDSESDDDNVPISKLKRKHIQELSSDLVRPDLSSSPPANISEDEKVTDTVMTRRRLLPLRKCVSKSQDGKISSCRPCKAKDQESIPSNVYADADESEDLSDTEEENMSDFIVDDSDVSDCEDTSSKSQDAANSDVDSDSANSQDLLDSNMKSDSHDVSDGDVDFGKILMKIQRSKNNMKWEFEADMLAAFGKDPELCMKAVCALYRQQTSEEQMSKGALFSNQRGFSKFDAHKGSMLAEFLTDGDPYGGLKKSVKELQENDPEAVELCRSLATHYSKQLYEIYKNKEDPLFPG